MLRAWPTIVTMHSPSEWSLHIDSELMYKSLSKMEEIKTAKHAMSSVQTERTRYKYVLYTERGSRFSNTCGDPNGSVREGEKQRRI